MRSGRAADSFGASLLILGTDFPHESGTIFEHTVTCIKTTAFAPATPTPPLGRPGRAAGLPAGDSCAQPLTEFLLPPSKMAHKN